jgi:uncharacterized protein with ParB-like and HNH nuclease domain
MSIGNVSKWSIEVYLNKPYFIPNYQREYAWETDEVSDFLDDVEETRRVKDRIHFFGQIVVHDDQKTGRRYIIDGQQRTITSVILLSVLSRFYRKLSQDTTSLDFSLSNNAIRKNILIENILGANSDGPIEGESISLTLGDADNSYFVNTFFKEAISVDSKAKKKSQERMRRAFLDMRDHIQVRLNEAGAPEEQFKCLNSYLEAFTKRFEVMYMEATELDEAFVIFETLNARGRDLETSDLLKNYVFSKSDPNFIETAQNLWTSMTDKLDNIDLTAYIRHYWNSSHQVTRTEALYRKIVQATKTRDDASKLLTNLEKYAPYYHDFLCPESPMMIEDDGLIEHLRNLKTLKAKTFFPIILAMLQSNQNFSEKEICKVLEVVENYVFRNATICGKTANTTEIFMGTIALKIYEDLDTVEKICDAISKGVVSDEEFQTAFGVWNKKTKETIRYILRKLNHALDNSYEISTDNAKVNIEHIMPENNSEWKVRDDIHSEYLWRLGNLTLLSGRFNASISNKPFAEKIGRYKESKLDLNKTIYVREDNQTERTTWTEKDIEARQALFAQMALKIWPKK